MKPSKARSACADRRSTFTLRLQPRLLVDAFASASRQHIPFGDWLERAVVKQLSGYERLRPSNAAEVDWFCGLAENDPECLPEHMLGAYEAISGDAWDRYWITPRVTVGQCEDGLVSDAEQRPYLNRQRVGEDWSRLVGDDSRNQANANEGDDHAYLADSTH